MKEPVKNYLDTNRESWNRRTEVHLGSAFYDVAGFLNGKSSLNSIELDLLGNITNKKILHLQCHFGQDTISLERLGAQVTGVDLSDKAIEAANELAKKCRSQAQFICCDVYDLPSYLTQQFDIVYTSYGTIGWLPDLERWAGLVSRFLKPGGRFIFVEFHPVLWVYDADFEKLIYSYFNKGPIVETETGTYADKNAPMVADSVTWNHGISEVITSLLTHDLQISAFREYDYSPYNCFNNMHEFAEGKWRISHLGDKLPMVYAIEAIKSQSHS